MQPHKPVPTRADPWLVILSGGAAILGAVTLVVGTIAAGLTVATALLAVGTPMWLVGRRRSARGHAAAPENPPSRPTEHR